MISDTKKVILITVLISLFFVLISHEITEWRQRIYSSAKIETIGIDIYADANFTIPLVQINWGNLAPSQSKDYIAYIISRSNVPITLALSTDNWNPLEAKKYLTLTWDYNQNIIASNNQTPVTLTLHVDPTITGIDTFTFDIIISAISLT